MPMVKINLPLKVGDRVKLYVNMLAVGTITDIKYATDENGGLPVYYVELDKDCDSELSCWYSDSDLILHNLVPAELELPYEVGSRIAYREESDLYKVDYGTITDVTFGSSGYIEYQITWDDFEDPENGNWYYGNNFSLLV